MSIEPPKLVWVAPYIGQSWEGNLGVRRVEDKSYELRASYVRKDLVTFTVDEIAGKIAPFILHSGVQRWQLFDAAKAIRELVLSRTEGS